MKLGNAPTTLLLNVFIHAKDLTEQDKKEIETELKKRGALV